MLKLIQKLLRQIFVWLELLFDKPFGPPWNPIRQLGTLAFYFFWISAVSGIYVFIFFDTSVSGAYDSVEYITHDQWYAAGVMRSLHRYASDGMVLAMGLHFLREFCMDRYRGVRWFAWITGLPVFGLLFFSGISGYWLVWDELAQYVAIGSMEWLDWFGIFGESIAENFLMRGSLDDRFFSLLVFIHIFAPLFLLFAMWIHIMRINRAKTNPPRGLALGSLGMLIALSLVYPALSHAPADLGKVPTVLNLDWYFMFLYPPFDAWGPGLMWALVLGSSVIFCAMPWLPPLKPKLVAPQVNLPDCNGCARCFDDCPYGAVGMRPRTDGAPYDQEAAVNASLCTACGICVGACPTSTPFRHKQTLTTGIDLPDFNLDEMFRTVDAAMTKVKTESGPNEPSVLVFGCRHGITDSSISSPGAAVVTLRCIGMLPPSFIDFALSRDGVDGVLLTGCGEGDCFHRLGIEWTDARMSGLRDPYLRKRVPRERLYSCWAGAGERELLVSEFENFRERLKSIDSEANAEPEPVRVEA